jgi:hypothetical protein
VASFLILMSYGEGFHKAMTLAFRAVGQELIIMDDGQTSLQAGGMRSGRAIRLEEKDADIIRENVPLVAAISPEVMRNVSVVRGNREKAVWPGRSPRVRTNPQHETRRRALAERRRQPVPARRPSSVPASPV